MDALTRKKISRTQLRHHCKKIEGKIDLLLDGVFPDDGLKQLKSLRLSYEAQIKKVTTANDAYVELLTTQAEIEADMEESLVLEDVFYSYLAKIDEKLDEVPSKSTETKPTISGSSSLEETVKTPKIEPPSFDGNIMNWQSWWVRCCGAQQAQDGSSQQILVSKTVVE
jgi:hypothetical protein